MRFAIVGFVLVTACAPTPQPKAAPAAASAVAPATGAYLPREALPDMTALLPPPPAPSTPAYAADRAAYEGALRGKDGPAWRQGVTQASLRSPAIQQQIMCALGVKLAPTGAVTRLMLRSVMTLAEASEAAKQHWKRPRPYTGEAGAEVCDPAASKLGSQSPSYPSGHAGTGWMWGLILTELAPERATPALAWGAAVGDNRIACRVHYPSDVAAGRQMGAAVLARLQAEPAFRADLEAARAEVNAARAAGAVPDCQAD